MGRITRTNFGITKVTTLTNAQIKALPTVAQTIIPAVTGKIVVPCYIGFCLSPWVADYTNIDGVTHNVDVNANGVFTPPTFTIAGLFAQGHATVIWCDYGREYDFTPENIASLKSQPWTLALSNGASGNLTGGDASTRLSITATYIVIPGDRFTI